MRRRRRKRRHHPAGFASCPSSRNRGCGERAPPSAALCLADGCRWPLRCRLRRIHRAHGAAYHGALRPAVERDCRRAETRSRRAGRARGGDARDLEQHHPVWPVDESRERLAGRAVGTSGVRPRPQFSRLSRLRRLPRHRPHQSAGAGAPRAADGIWGAAASAGRRARASHRIRNRSRRARCASRHRKPPHQRRCSRQHPTARRHARAAAQRCAGPVRTAPRATSAPMPLRANVVPFRAGGAGRYQGADVSVRSSAKHSARLAQELTARLRAAARSEESRRRRGTLAAEEQEAPADAAERASSVAAIRARLARCASADATLQSRSRRALLPSRPQRSRRKHRRASRVARIAMPRPRTPPRRRVRAGAARPLPVGVLLHQHARCSMPTAASSNGPAMRISARSRQAGGLDDALRRPRRRRARARAASAAAVAREPRAATSVPVEGRLFTVPWGDGSALALVLTQRRDASRSAARSRLALDAAEGQIGELKTRLAALDKTEDELRAAKREAHKAAAEKADFLAKVSHEIRTPLNAITGFAEVIMAERFGPIGNERYRDYLKDIHAAGTHLVSLLNDLLDLSKIETGQLDLTFAQCRPQRAHPAMRRHHAAAGEPGAHHHPHLADAGTAAGHGRRALAAPDRAQPPCQLDQVHRSRRPGDRIDGVRRQRREPCCACAIPASA